MAVIEITSEFITLAQALKIADVTGSGGEAKNLVRGGTVRVNGAVELQPGKKLRVGDKFQVEGADGGGWTIGAKKA